MKGKIVITDKVYFEPDGLEKPNPDDYYGYYEAVREYEASKQLIEVENEIEHRTEKNIYMWFKFKLGSSLFTVKNNQPCTAEITDKQEGFHIFKTATIIKLL